MVVVLKAKYSPIEVENGSSLPFGSKRSRKTSTALELKAGLKFTHGKSLNFRTRPSTSVGDHVDASRMTRQFRVVRFKGNVRGKFAIAKPSYVGSSRMRPSLNME